MEPQNQENKSKEDFLMKVSSLSSKTFLEEIQLFLIDQCEYGQCKYGFCFSIDTKIV